MDSRPFGPAGGALNRHSILLVGYAARTLIVYKVDILARRGLDVNQDKKRGELRFRGRFLSLVPMLCVGTQPGRSASHVRKRRAFGGGGDAEHHHQIF